MPKTITVDTLTLGKGLRLYRTYNGDGSPKGLTITVLLMRSDGIMEEYDVTASVAATVRTAAERQTFMAMCGELWDAALADIEARNIGGWSK